MSQPHLISRLLSTYQALVQVLSQSVSQDSSGQTLSSSGQEPQSTLSTIEEETVEKTHVSDTEVSVQKTPSVAKLKTKFELNQTAGGSKFYKIVHDKNEHEKEITGAAFKMGGLNENQIEIKLVHQIRIKSCSFCLI